MLEAVRSGVVTLSYWPDNAAYTVQTHAGPCTSNMFSGTYLDHACAINMFRHIFGPYMCQLLYVLMHIFGPCMCQQYVQAHIWIIHMLAMCLGTYLGHARASYVLGTQLDHACVSNMFRHIFGPYMCWLCVQAHIWTMHVLACVQTYIQTINMLAMRSGTYLDHAVLAICLGTYLDQTSVSYVFAMCLGSYLNRACASNVFRHISGPSMCQLHVQAPYLAEASKHRCTSGPYASKGRHLIWIMFQQIKTHIQIICQVTRTRYIRIKCQQTTKNFGSCVSEQKHTFKSCANKHGHIWIIRLRAKNRSGLDQAPSRIKDDVAGKYKTLGTIWLRLCLLFLLGLRAICVMSRGGGGQCHWWLGRPNNAGDVESCRRVVKIS